MGLLMTDKRKITKQNSETLRVSVRNNVICSQREGRLVHISKGNASSLMKSLQYSHRVGPTVALQGSQQGSHLEVRLFFKMLSEEQKTGNDLSIQ